MRLSDEDGRAVDLLLDRPASKGDGNGNHDGTSSHAAGAVAPAANGQAQRRIEAATSVLDLLSNLEAPEPPADLLERTLRKIEEITAAGHVGVPAGATIGPRPSPQQPHA